MRKSNPLDEINEMVKKMEIADAEFAIEDAALEEEWQDLHSDEDDELDEDDDLNVAIYEDDGQPSEYDEWQDFYGGDDGDQGQYDLEDYHDSGIDF